MTNFICRFINKRVQIVTSNNDSFIGTLFIPDKQEEWVGLIPLIDESFEKEKSPTNTVYKKLNDITTIITLDE